MFFFFFGAATEEDELVKLKTLVFPGQSLPSQSPETELILEGDDDSAGLLQEKETDGLGGESRFPIGRSCCVSAHDETRRVESSSYFAAQMPQKMEPTGTQLTRWLANASDMTKALTMRQIFFSRYHSDLVQVFPFV